jgi:DnaJ-class molecular chaperone
VRCPVCKGKRFVEIPITVEKRECGNCKGTGRIKMEVFNPVIPKGAIL